jgi:3-deoxy-D-manno-octulosonic-acid transferase
MLWIIYNLLFPLVFVFMLPKFISRMLKRGGYGRHFEQRIGHFGANTKEQLKARRRIWVHAVSVGEMYVALRFMKAYREAHPEACFALSTTTSTGHAIAGREIDPPDVLFYFPVDFPPVISKVLRIVNPRRIVLVEGEFWPNLIRLADRAQIPVSLINGRMSENSYRGYRRLRALTADVLRRIDPVCVQGPGDAERLMHLGARSGSVQVMGTVKFDVAERDPAGEQAARELLQRIRVPDDAVILLGGSTWPGEEEVLCELYRTLRTRHPELFLILVPRHAERGDEVVQCLEKQGFTFVRRSRLEAQPADAGGPQAEVLLVDTTGELRNFYSAADIIFVGKSLTEHGGQNPIEPAMYGKAVLVGPNMENFPAVMEAFRRTEAIRQVADAEALAEAVGELAADPSAAAELGRRAARVVEENRGVIERTVMRLDAQY